MHNLWILYFWFFVIANLQFFNVNYQNSHFWYIISSALPCWWWWYDWLRIHVYVWFRCAWRVVCSVTVVVFLYSTAIGEQCTFTILFAVVMSVICVCIATPQATDQNTVRLVLLVYPSSQNARLGKPHNPGAFLYSVCKCGASFALVCLWSHQRPIQRNLQEWALHVNHY